MEKLVAEQVAWQGKVRAVMVNQNVATLGLDDCSLVVKLPLLQDDEAGAMWTTMGALYNSFLLFDQNGVLIKIWLQQFLPEFGDELTASVNALLD